jgi:hypothetical protein
MATSGFGTFETCSPILRTSVHRGRPEVAVVRSNDANGPFADISKSKQTEMAETRSTAAQLRKCFCHRKGIEPTFREGSPRSCAKM